MTENPEYSVTDAMVLARIREGDKDAYIILVRRYAARLRSILSFYCSVPEAVEEFIQDAFVQAYIHLNRFDSQRPLLPWLKAIALNSLKDELRRQASTARRQKDYVHHLQLTRLQNDPGGEGAEARLAALDKCLDELSPRQHDLLQARYRQTRPVAELARRMKLTENALKVRLLRLRRALRDCITRRLKPGEGKPDG